MSGFRVFWEFVSENLEAAAASFVRGGQRESFVAVERIRCQFSLSLSLSLSLFRSFCVRIGDLAPGKKNPRKSGFCRSCFFFEIYLILHFLLGFQGVICLAEQNSKTAD